MVTFFLSLCIVFGWTTIVALFSSVLFSVFTIAGADEDEDDDWFIIVGWAGGGGAGGGADNGRTGLGLEKGIW